MVCNNGIPDEFPGAWGYQHELAECEGALLGTGNRNLRRDRALPRNVIETRSTAPLQLLYQGLVVGCLYDPA